MSKVERYGEHALGNLVSHSRLAGTRALEYRDVIEVVYSVGDTFLPGAVHLLDVVPEQVMTIADKGSVPG